MTADPTLRQLLRWLTGITRPVHPPLYASTAFRILGLALQLLFYGIAGAGIVAIARGGSPWPVFGWLVVVALAKAGLFYLEQFSGHYVAFKALELLRTTVFAKLWPKAPAVVTHSRSGDVLASLTRDVDRIEVVYAHTFAPVVSAFVVPPAALLLVGGLVDWRLVVVPAVCVAVSLLIVPWFGFRRALRAGDVLLGARRRLSHHVTDSVFGVEEVVGYGLQGRRLTEADALGDEVARASLPSYRANAWRRGLNVALLLATTLSVVWVGVGIGVDAALLAGLAAGSLRLFEGPRGIEDAAGYLDKSLAAALRLWHMAHAPEAVHDGPETLTLDHSPEVRLAGVDFSYRDAAGDPVHRALQGVHLTFPAGSHTVIVGPSGSGKSTTAHALQRYFDPDAGQVLIDGVPATSYTLDSLRRNVVAVSQGAQLLNATIAENLRLGAPDATEEDLLRALRIAAFDEDLALLPQGLATPVGQFGTKLSGGQAQRITLARALLLQPRVLILDEVTAHLNDQLARTIRANIARELDGVTLIEITHRLESADGADQVVLFDRGRVVASAGAGSADLEAGLAEFFAANV